LRLKISIEEDERISSGNEFQMAGAAERNEREAKLAGKYDLQNNWFTNGQSHFV
jgi:hypothetical protein